MIKKLFKLFEPKSQANVQEKIKLKNYEYFLGNLKNAGLSFHFSDEFIAKLNGRNSKGTSIIKHDVHHDLSSCLIAAELENKLDVSAVYFFLGEHDLSKSYYGTTEFWSAVNKIKDLGHEIALHVDVFDLILRYGSVTSGLEYQLNEFKKHANVTIHSANMHGNTALRKLHGSPKALVRARNADMNSLPHLYPLSSDMFSQFVSLYTLEDFSSQFGLRNWMDPIIYENGEKINVDYFLSDNGGKINMIHQDVEKIFINFNQMGEDLAPKFKALISAGSSQFLIHTQNLSY